MCSGAERHHLDGHVLQLGEIADLFDLPAQRLWTTDGAVQRFLADDQPQPRSAWRAQALRALGVSSVNVKWDGQVLKGAKADDISAAMTRRESHTR